MKTPEKELRETKELRDYMEKVHKIIGDNSTNNCPPPTMVKRIKELYIKYGKGQTENEFEASYNRTIKRLEEANCAQE